MSDEEVVAVRNGAASSRALAPAERPSATFADEAVAYYEDEDQQWTVQKLVALCIRRRNIILGVFATILTLFVVMALITPRVYRSSATLLVSSPPKGAGMGEMTAISGMLDAQGRSLATEVEILQSKPVRDAAFELLPPPLRNARLVSLEARVRGTTDLVDISTTSTDPQFAEQFTKALANAYVQQAKGESRRQYKDTADYVSDQVGTIKAKMDEASNNLRRFKEETGIADLASESETHVTGFQTLQEALKTAQADLLAGQAQLRGIQSAAAALPRVEKAPSVFTKRMVVQQLEERLTTLQSELTAVRQEFTPNSPEVRDIQGQIAQTRAQLAREPREEVTSSTSALNETRQTLEQQAAQLRAQNAGNASRVAALKNQVAVALREKGTLPQREYRLNQLQLDLATYQVAYKTLNERLVNLRISEAAPVSKARIQTPADTAYQVRPNLRNSILAGIFMGLLAALAIAVMVDRMDNRIHSEDDIRAATHQLPILAFIPKVSHFEAESIVALATHPEGNQHTPLLESYRMLRTSLMFTVVNSPLRCIMLTSSQPHEGKSSVAANLATVLAMNGKSVLLIDADLRRPSTHRLFGLSGEQGFTSVVAGLCTLEEAIQETPVSGLKVLAVGPTPPNPPEMLDSHQSRALLEHAREIADFVIIDAPPALMMADAQIIATQVDGVLLVVSWEEALKDAVARTNELIARTGAKMLGVVVNKWDDRQAAYQNYQKHYKAFDDDGANSKN
ncbi:MAG: polysaccharide biosynthesis tyrosine autokinase [Armatimonadetes bacterium]|nr:polysaccharide biosynthesis tyrosine autokinase [Armatimonadota bacterium]